MRPLGIALQKLKQALCKNAAPQTPRAVESCAKTTDATAGVGAKRDNSKKTMDQLKKKDILERNRASSMRARAKRKAWIQQLERNVTNVNEANAALQMEVKALRAEVAKLKTLLLAHRDCPVTKAMQKGKSSIRPDSSLFPQRDVDVPICSRTKVPVSVRDVPNRSSAWNEPLSRYLPDHGPARDRDSRDTRRERKGNLLGSKFSLPAQAASLLLFLAFHCRKRHSSRA